MKGNIATNVLLCIAIIIIILMCAYTYKLYTDNKELSATVDDLSNQVYSLEDNINSLQASISKPSNTTNENKEYDNITEELPGIDVLYVTNAIKNGDSYTLQGVIYTQYTLSSSGLQDILDKGFMIIDNEKYTIKNSNTTGEYNLYKDKEEYPLFIIRPLSSSSYYLETQAQISDTWKLTNDYKEIKIPSDTKCNRIFDYEEENQTVDDVFKDYKEATPSDTTHPNYDRTFSFKFENGKCVEVVNVLTSV